MPQATGVVAPIRTLLDSLSNETPSSLDLQRSLSEAWFSNTLAWLLDPTGAHGMGVRFAKELAVTIGRVRSEGSISGVYARRATFLKTGRSGSGVGATGFRFRNASAVREFFLSGSIKRGGLNARYCDVAFLDVDSGDSFLLIVENKLFRRPSASQLSEYLTTVDQKFDRVKLREFVCLTLRRTDPLHRASERPIGSAWVHLSWTEDILGILKKLAAKNGSPDIQSLTHFLSWLDKITDPSRLAEPERVAFRDHVVRAAAECLWQELTRLHAADGGQWEIESPEGFGRSVDIWHSTQPRSKLVVRLLPGLSVIVDSRRPNGRLRFPKIVVPFGAHPSQVFNLLDLAARDVYRLQFSPRVDHRAGGRWRPVNRGEIKARHAKLFEFLHRHHHELRVALYSSLALGHSDPKEDNFSIA